MLGNAIYRLYRRLRWRSSSHNATSPNEIFSTSLEGKSMDASAIANAEWWANFWHVFVLIGGFAVLGGIVLEVVCGIFEERHRSAIAAANKQEIVTLRSRAETVESTSAKRIEELQSALKAMAESGKEYVSNQGIITTDQFDELVPALRELGKQFPIALDIAAPRFPSISWQYANVLNRATWESKTAVRSPPIVFESAQHKGIAILAKKETPAIKQLAQVLRTTGHIPQIITDKYPELIAVDENVKTVDELLNRFNKAMPDKEYAIISVGILEAGGP
ncbi:MAG TPA: hypothetical protein VMJ32_18450 [Pirellulales bacterium]|nr:hypothetical protein [Pirellulales bacterium]